MDRTLLFLLTIALLLIGYLFPTALISMGITLTMVTVVTRGSWAMIQAFTTQQQVAEVEVID